MFRILKFELYAAFHKTFFWALFVIIVAISIPITGVGANRTAYHVLVFDSSSNESYLKAIQAIIDRGYYARYDSKMQKYLIESEAESLIKPGGSLHQEYGWLLEKDYTRKQFIEDTYYSEEAENVYETWVFERILKDRAAIGLLGMIFAVYFFGQGFVHRGFSAFVLAGRSRAQILIGKFSAYLAVSLLLSLAVLVAAIIKFVPDVFVLGNGYVMRCIGTRIIIDAGFLCLPAIFPFIFKDIMKSAGACLLFISLFLSNRAIVNLHIYDFYFNNALWLPEFSFKVFYPVLLTTLAIFAAVFAGSTLLFHRSQLK